VLNDVSVVTSVRLSKLVTRDWARVGIVVDSILDSFSWIAVMSSTVDMGSVVAIVLLELLSGGRTKRVHDYHCSNVFQLRYSSLVLNVTTWCFLVSAEKVNLK